MARIKFDNPSEVMRFHAKESWVPVILGAVPVAVACALVCVVIALPMQRGDLLPWAILASAVVTILSRIPHIVDNWRTDVIITDRRLYYRRGIIAVKDHVCDLSTITDITVDPTVLGRIFKYADVVIQTQAGDDDFVLKEIKDAYTMRQMINRGRDESATTPPTPRRSPQDARRSR